MSTPNRSLVGPAIALMAVGIAIGVYLAPHFASSRKKAPAARPPAEGRARVTEHQLAQGQLLVIDVTAPMPGIPDMLEARRCFVWREPQLSSTMSCDPRAEVSLDEP